MFHKQGRKMCPNKNYNKNLKISQIHYKRKRLRYKFFYSILYLFFYIRRIGFLCTRRLIFSIIFLINTLFVYSFNTEHAMNIECRY